MSYQLKHKSKIIELPDFNEIPVGVLRKARNLNEQEQTWFILEFVLDEKALAVLDEVPLSEFAKHMKAWTGGVALGE